MKTWYKTAGWQRLPRLYPKLLLCFPITIAIARALKFAPPRSHHREKRLLHHPLGAVLQFPRRHGAADRGDRIVAAVVGPCMDAARAQAMPGGAVRAARAAGRRVRRLDAEGPRDAAH